MENKKKYFIYKIISPSNRIYIGQTNNLKKRIYQYRGAWCKKQTLLYNSLIKYGWKNHKFEIIEECNIDEINEKEIYWIDFYKSNHRTNPENKGLNLTNGGDKPPKTHWIREEEYKLKVSSFNTKNHAKKRISNIKQYDLTGNFIKIWNIDEFNKNCEFRYFHVKRCCDYKMSQHKNFIWCYENDSYDIHILKKKIRIWKHGNIKVKN